MKLSERIKKYRKDNKMTQSEFAELLFVSKQAVSKWELEKGMPDISLLPELSKILGVSVDELMGVSKKEVNIKKNKSILIISIVLILLIILLFIIFGDFKKIKRTEKILNINMPKVTDYSYVTLDKWIYFNNIEYPQIMYFYVFEDNNELASFEKSLSKDNNWEKELSDEILEYFPEILLKYYETGSCFKFLVEDGDSSLISNETGKYNCIFSCYQDVHKRLIVFEFELEVKNENKN